MTQRLNFVLMLHKHLSIHMYVDAGNDERGTSNDAPRVGR